jgi:hypothetical protein
MRRRRAAREEGARGASRSLTAVVVSENAVGKLSSVVRAIRLFRSQLGRVSGVPVPLGSVSESLGMLSVQGGSSLVRERHNRV